MRFSACKASEKAVEARVGVRALTVMNLALVSKLGSPCEVTERSEDQGEGKGPRHYGPCSSSPVFASPWAKGGPEDTTFRPNFIINRTNLTIN